MCLSPILLSNPMARRLWSFREKTFLDDEPFYADVSFSVYSHLCGAYENVNGNFQVVKDCYLIDDIVRKDYIIVNGTRVNCFISAPCGKCLLCKDARRFEYESRALFEASDNPNMFFFTFTYRDKDLPSDGLKVSDVSAALKRFRTNLSRWYSRKFDKDMITSTEAVSFRCFYAGEYGVDPKYTQRAHYHGVMFFRNPIPPRYLRAVFFILLRAWGHGRIDFQYCKKPAACARYVTKYITKQDLSHVPKGKNPCFVRGPHQCGLGSEQLSRHVDDILSSTNNRVLLRIGNSVVPVKIPKFLLQKIFPSFSKIYKDVSDDFYKCELLRKVLIERNKFSSPECPFGSHYDVTKCDDILDSFSWLRQGFNKTHSKSFDVSKFIVYVNEQSTDYLVEYYMSLLAHLIDYLPTVQMFEDAFFPKLIWQSKLVFPESTLDERLTLQQNKSLNNLNYVHTHMLGDEFCLHLQK